MKKLLAGLVLCLALVLGGVLTACATTGNQAVKDVSVMIEQIGDVADISLDSQDAIGAARSAYDALSEEDKAEVSNYADLQAAEAELATLKEIDALALTITSAASMKSGAEYAPSLSGYEYNDVQTTVAWSVADVGTTGASIENGIVTASGIGRFTLVATVSYAGHNIENQAAITVEVGGYTVSGTVSFPEGNENLVSRVSVRSTSGIVGQVTVGENGVGVFTVGVPQGDTTLVFSAPAFEDVTLELENVLADNDAAGEAAFSAYRYTNGAVWAPAQGRVTYQDDKVIVGAVDEDAYATLAFADVRSTQVYLQATITDIYAAREKNCFDIGFAPILLSEDSYAYEVRQNFTGTAYEKGIARLQGNASNPWVSWMNGTGNNVVFKDTNGAWLNKDIAENEEGKIEGVTVTLTLIRDGNKVYVWTQLAGEGAVYHGVDVLDEKYVDYEAGFGLFTRAGTGATFTDISFSTDAEFIAEKLQGSVTLTAETGTGNANGTVTLTDGSGNPVTAASLGEELTLTVTPKPSTQTDIYYISAATLNDENILDRLEAQQDGSYTYTFTVRGDVSVQVTITKEVLKTVTGEITLPVGYEYLLAEGTVSAEGVAATAISADGIYSLNVPAGTQKIVVTLPGFSKEASLDTAQTQGEALDIELTTADFAFEQGGTSNRQEWENVNGSVVVHKATSDIISVVTVKDVESNAFFLIMTVSNIYVGRNANTFDVGFSIWNGSKVLSYEVRESGNIARFSDAFGWNDGGWIGSSVPGLANLDTNFGKPNENGLYTDISITMTIAYQNGQVHLWIDETYLGVADIPDGYLSANDVPVQFGAFTRAGTGATFSDISFSTDPEVVAEKLSCAIMLTAETGTGNANGTVTLTDAEGQPIASGDTVTVGSQVTAVVQLTESTATEIYGIGEFTVNGHDVLGSLTDVGDGKYTYTFTVGKNTEIAVTLTVSQSTIVTGTVSVPAGNENLLASGTVKTGTASASIGANGNFTIIVPRNASSLTVAVPGFSKTVEVALDSGEYEFAEAIALTSADYVFEKGYSTNGASWQKNADGSVSVERIEKDATTSIVFSELKSDAFMISATIGNIYSGNGNGTFDVGFSMMLASGNMLAYELRESGVVARLYDPGWKWINGTDAKIDGIADWNAGSVSGYNSETHCFDGLTITVTMVLKDSTLYLWANGQFLGSTQDAAQFVGTDAVSLGVFTRTGTGATFSDISFSTDSAFVAEYLAQNVAVEN